MKKSNPIPFDFVLEQLFTVNPRVKPMFGCHAIYMGEKIVLILRNKPGVHDADNGIWISTKAEHHIELRKIFPSMRSIRVLGNATNWQILPLDSDDFEESAFTVCDLILKGDPRIGNVPKAKKKKIKPDKQPSGKKRKKSI